MGIPIPSPCPPVSWTQDFHLWDHPTFLPHMSDGGTKAEGGVASPRHMLLSTSWARLVQACVQTNSHRFR